MAATPSDGEGEWRSHGTGWRAFTCHVYAIFLTFHLRQLPVGKCWAILPQLRVFPGHVIPARYSSGSGEFWISLCR